MNLHDKFKQAQTELGILESGLSKDGPNMHMSITTEGMRIETRSPSGSGDIVHHLYLTSRQAVWLHDYIASVFLPVDKADK